MPMAANIKLPKLEVPAVDQHLYQSMLGSLMYAVIGTHPNIMFTIHHLSQFLAAPSLEHLVAMKQVYQYLSGTRNLRIPRGQSPGMHLYSVGLSLHGQLKSNRQLLC